jgi:hypothetical protein
VFEPFGVFTLELFHDHTLFIDVTIGQYHTALYMAAIAFVDNFLRFFERFNHSELFLNSLFLP